MKMDDILKDSRFTKYLSDPRYRQIPKHERKVKIDKRFQSMFNDDKFKVKYTIDKRGRPINETSTENLRKYYDLESDEGSSSEQASGDEGKFVKKPLSDNEQDKEEENHNFKNDKLIQGKLNKKTKEKLQDLDIDYARGEGFLLSDSSSDEESSEVDEESDLEHEWGELDADAGSTEESTKRIAICNMDWDNIKAVDIMVLLNSFLPSGGVITRITIYPSEFGLKRMQEEEVRGPVELTEKKVEAGISGENENEEGSAYHMEKLRQYQLNRLKYYYAVVECDSVSTADKLYSECDGLEYESSATKLDLRFIPDDVTFDQEPRETCTKLPDMSRYKARTFTTTALQQVKVELTWDATNPNRTDAIKGALNGNIDDLDLKEYLASSTDEESDNNDNVSQKSDDEPENDDDAISKYKNLLKDIQEKEDNKKNKDMELEVTWEVGIKDKAEELVKKKIQEGNSDLTPFEKILEKRKEKKKQKKLERQKKLTKNADDSNSEIDGNSSDDIPSDVNMNDPYFAEEFNKPEFRKSKNKKPSKDEDELSESKERMKAELELLLDDDNDSKAHFSLKKIQEAESTSKKSKRKRKLKEKMIQSKQLDNFEVNVNDKRFSALYDSHHFNIDPTDPNFKKTKNMEKIIYEKLKRRPVEVQVEVPAKKSKEDIELNMLVKNIKRKTKNFNK